MYSLVFKLIHDSHFYVADPYHTYLSLAALSMYPPKTFDGDARPETWTFDSLDPLLNARTGTALWARKYIPAV